MPCDLTSRDTYKEHITFLGKTSIGSLSRRCISVFSLDGFIVGRDQLSKAYFILLPIPLQENLC